ARSVRPTTTIPWYAPITRCCCGTSVGASRCPRSLVLPIVSRTRFSGSRSSCTPASRKRSPMYLRDVDEIVSAAELARTADAIAEWQLPSGMIPWFPGGHADPWNHVEAAMALDLAGHRSKAERAYEWLVRMQRPDGAWHQYYLADSVEQDKLDA